MIDIEDQEEVKEDKPAIKNVELKKNVVLKKGLKVGEIAHYHKKEDEEKTWEEACLVVQYTILDEKGFRINDERYSGTVIVPQCLADHFAYMDSVRARYEAGVFQGTTRQKVVGSL